MSEIDVDLHDDGPAEPWPLVRAWLPADDDPERPVATLATVDLDGTADARTVLVSEADERGLAFHTDERSRKVAQLRAHPAAALVVRWPEAARQLVVRGPALPETAEDAARVYGRRTPYLQALAWLNTHDHARTPSGARRAAWAAFTAEHPVGTLEPPPTWVGFRLRPTSLTFWVGSTDATSRRTEYRLRDGVWAREHLAG